MKLLTKKRNNKLIRKRFLMDIEMDIFNDLKVNSKKLELNDEKFYFFMSTKKEDKIYILESILIDLGYSLIAEGFDFSYSKDRQILVINQDSKKFWWSYSYNLLELLTGKSITPFYGSLNIPDYFFGEDEIVKTAITQHGNTVPEYVLDYNKSLFDRLKESLGVVLNENLRRIKIYKRK